MVRTYPCIILIVVDKCNTLSPSAVRITYCLFFAEANTVTTSLQSLLTLLLFDKMFHVLFYDQLLVIAYFLLSCVTNVSPIITCDATVHKLSD